MFDVPRAGQAQATINVARDRTDHFQPHCLEKYCVRLSSHHFTPGIATQILVYSANPPMFHARLSEALADKARTLGSCKTARSWKACCSYPRARAFVFVWPPQICCLLQPCCLRFCSRLCLSCRRLLPIAKIPSCACSVRAPVISQRDVHIT